MKIFPHILGAFQTNCYIIASEKNNAIIIDPACEGEKLITFLTENKLNLKKILLTHGHYDHIGSADFLREKTGAKIFINKADERLLKDSSVNASKLIPYIKYEIFSADVFIKNEDEIKLDEITLKVMETPGHTAGSVIFIAKNERIIFTGDTIFEGTIGRTDLYSGDYSKIMQSVRKINEFDGDYRILAGHGDETTLEAERRNNPYF